MGTDTQSFSFTAKNQKRFNFYNHETAEVLGVEQEKVWAAGRQRKALYAAKT